MGGLIMTVRTTRLPEPMKNSQSRSLLDTITQVPVGLSLNQESSDLRHNGKRQNVLSHLFASMPSLEVNVSNHWHLVPGLSL